MTENFNESANTEYVDKQKVELFLTTNRKYFPDDKIVFLREKLCKVDDSKFILLSTVALKNPTAVLLISIFLGGFGIDRFMIGETGMGVLKLLTAGCCGVLTVIDWFTIAKKTREKNFNKLMLLI